jgi:hypothetical protein
MRPASADTELLKADSAANFLQLCIGVPMPR